MHPTDGPLTAYTPWQASPTPAWAPPPPPPPPSLPPPRGRRGLMALIVGGALLAGLAIGVPVGLLTRSSHSNPSSRHGPAAVTPVPRSPAALQARALFQQALAATGASAGFHYVSVSKGGPDSQTITGDAGQKGGTQLITVDSTFGHEQFTLILAGTTVYFQGNAPALQDQLGVSAAKAPGYDGRWITVSPGDGPYDVVAPGITVADQVQEIVLVPASSSQVTSNGVTVIRITGTLPAQSGSGAGTVTLDIAPDTHLPITQVTKAPAGGATITSTTTFSAWGTAPSPAAPTGTVAWSTLGATQPPGGYGNGGATPGASASPSPSASSGV